MKTVTIAAVLMVLMPPAWAEEAAKNEANGTTVNEPIVLSDAEMDGVTAGSETELVVVITPWLVNSSSTSRTYQGRFTGPDGPVW